VNDSPLGLPTITGTATEDQVLTAVTTGISDADGLGAFSYQWLRGGAAIGGATASTYTLGDADVGTQISVEVTYTDGEGTAEGPLVSAQTAAVANVNDSPVGLPTITGTVTEDQVLTADTTGISDADGLGPFSFQWLRDGAAIGGATASTYTLGDADVGARISVEVSYTDGEGTAEGPLTSAQTTPVNNVNDVPVGVPTITGTATEDQILTADTSGINDPDGLGAFGYQWLRDGVAVGGATASTYTLGDADVGTRLSVAVDYIDGHGTSEGPLTSAQTVLVININDAPNAEGDAYTTLQTDSLAISPSGVLLNDSDIDGDPLTAVLVSGTTFGSLTLNADGSFNYIPTGTFVGIDSFVYVATDGLLSSAPITVTIEVEPVSLAGGGDPDSDPPPEDPPEEEPIEDEPDVEEPAEEEPTPEEDALTSEASPTPPPATLGVSIGPFGGPSSAEPDDGIPLAVGFANEIIAASDVSIMQLARTALSTSHIGTLVQPSLRALGLGEAVSTAPLSLFMHSDNWAPTEDDSRVTNIEVALGTTKVVTTAVTAGYVVWMVRGGSLFASMAASLPVWTTFDPLPILTSFEESGKSEEDDEERLVDLIN
jgi:hypothetical protein